MRNQCPPGNEALVGLFPEPEVYHEPDPDWPEADLGQFGAAETGNGELRQIDEAEAREVGLLDGTYQQVYLSEELQQLLDDAIAD